MDAQKAINDVNRKAAEAKKKIEASKAAALREAENAQKAVADAEKAANDNSAAEKALLDKEVARQNKLTFNAVPPLPGETHWRRRRRVGVSRTRVHAIIKVKVIGKFSIRGI